MPLRPTPDALRERAFAVLGPRVVDARVLDLYAGTGSIGLEALSRGARRAVFVERHQAAARLVRRNIAQFEDAETITRSRMSTGSNSDRRACTAQRRLRHRLGRSAVRPLAGRTRSPGRGLRCRPPRNIRRRLPGVPGSGGSHGDRHASRNHPRPRRRRLTPSHHGTVQGQAAATLKSKTQSREDREVDAKKSSSTSRIRLGREEDGIPLRCSSSRVFLRYLCVFAVQSSRRCRRRKSTLRRWKCGANEDLRTPCRVCG